MDNIVFGFCLWDILTGVLLVGVVVGYIFWKINTKKKEKKSR